MGNNKRPTQCERLKQYFKDFGSITQLEALRDLGIFRLASRVSEMKKDGYAIKDKQECVLNRYGEKCHIKRYYIEQGEQNND
jgi:hypothetical protein